MTSAVKRGDIYYVVGGAVTGSEQNANRPAVVVSNNVGNRYAPIVEVVYLTTRLKAGLPTHVFIGSAERPSIALCEQIVTICKSRLERRIGHVTQEEMNNIDKALTKSLGIHKTGGCTMQITMKTPFGEMNFDMPQEKVSDLMQRAFQYAAGQEPPKTSPAAPPVAQEPPKAPDTAIKPQSRVERMFGNFKAAQGAAQSNAPTAAQSEPPKGPESCKGFLLVKCEECGKIRGFCAKTPATSSRCECGHRTELHGMRIAHLECKCGSRFTYHTNITEEVFDYPCLHCGSPVDLRLNKRGDTYVTIKD